MPFDRRQYPADWPEIRARILARDGYRCQRCGVSNYAAVVRGSEGKILTSVQAQSFADGKRLAHLLTTTLRQKAIVIVLVVAHVDNPDPLDCRDDNLATLCQWHHLQLDKYLHSKNARATRRQKQSRRQGAQDDAA